MNCNTTLPESSYHTIDCLEEIGAERESAGRSSLKGREGGHRQSDEHWNRFKGSVEGTSERQGEGAHIPSLTELNCLNKTYLKTNKN